MTASQTARACPKCGSEDVVALGTEGARARSLEQGFGPFVRVFVPAIAGDSGRLRYKCNTCRKKFVAEEEPPEGDQPQEAACTVVFHRDSSFVGAMSPEFVYLNGQRVGEVKNGKSIEFVTTVRSNVLTVTDENGVAFKDSHAFEAVDGGVVEVHFNRKFK